MLISICGTPFPFSVFFALFCFVLFCLFFLFVFVFYVCIPYALKFLLYILSSTIKYYKIENGYRKFSYYHIAGLWGTVLYSTLIICTQYVPDEGYFRDASCALNLIYTFLSLSLCWWIISSRSYHPPSSQCFGTDMVY